MNANEPDESKPLAADAPQAGPAVADEAPAKPKRARVAKAPATVEPTEPLPPPAGTDPGTKPVRPGRRKKALETVDSTAEGTAGLQATAREPLSEPAPGPSATGVDVAEASDAAPATRKPRAPRVPRRAAQSLEGDAGTASDAPVTTAPDLPPDAGPVAYAEAEPGAGAAVEPLSIDTESTGDAGASNDSLVPREGSRRSRNRRRKRGDRALRFDGRDGESPAPEGDDAGVDAEPAAPAVVLEPTDPNEVFAEVLSGAFDAEPPVDAAAAPSPEPPKRVLAPEPDAPKLHKVLAQAGIGSRRDMEQWVLEGRVTVNGEPAHTGQRISFGDRIAIGGKPVKVRIAPPPPRVLAYHKPAGEVVTHDDPQQRPTVFRRLPRLQHGKWQSVGRLDLNTEGLLLFTNSGDLANQLMHPRFGVEREYAVRSLGVLDPEQRDRLLEGVDIDGQRCAFKSIEDGGGEGVNHWYRVVITEGRNREVRRLFEAVGHAVSRLIRIRYGCVVLPRGLKRGVWIDLPEPDVKALRRLTGTDRPRDGDADPGPRGKRGRRGGKNRDGRPREGAAPERSPDRGPRPDRAPRGDGEGPLNIPNPLQQTYDKRAIQQARSSRREIGEDDPIPNPLQQTYDRRALQRERSPARELPDDGPIPNPLQQTYDKRFVQKSSGFGGGGGGGRPGRPGRPGRGGGGAGGGQRQPDPMQTAVGYIGADAFRNKGGKGGGRGGHRGNKGGPKGGGGGRGGGRGPR